ncbi:hypothetical protein TruAng_001393 [Truncatella angustata]|nr:hypothetical protein TruAng_001393 [Truncatella angustata]
MVAVRNSIAAFIAVCGTCATHITTNSSSDCYCLPSDACWPSADKWNTLNTTVDGKLIATVPLGSVCHDPAYDEAVCEALKAAWRDPEPHTEDIAATVKFAGLHNVRLVIRNTGHDFIGRSSGAGGLAVWTHHLKSLEVIENFEMQSEAGEEGYSGTALKMGSGVQGFEAEAFAGKYGLVVVGGWCPSVGIAGGYTQGGGHSPLGSEFGMAADQTLEFEVVTADGSVVIASPQENNDLYWALSGGGPGTYGIVTSVIVRAYPDLPVGGAFVYVSNDLSQPNASTILDNHWATIKTWYSLLPNLTSNGIGATFSYNNSLFVVVPLTAYNKTSEEVTAALKPWTDHLDSVGMSYTAQFTDFPSYYPHWSAFVTPGPVGGFWQSISRLVPSSILSDPQTLSTYVNVSRNFADQGAMAGCTAIAPKKRTSFHNAVLPAWREAAAIHGLMHEWSDEPSLWDDMQEMQRYTDEQMAPVLKSATGGSAGPKNTGAGSYVNEVQGVEIDWKDESFGINYQRLLQVKRKWDSDGVFWGPRLVGSESRQVTGEPRDIGDGRLCRTRY